MNPTPSLPEQQPAGPTPEIPTVPAAEQTTNQTVAPAAPVPMAPVTTPAPSAGSDVPVTPGPIAGAPPTIADDVDVIEKEWVDQADAVIKRTADDPHAEEEAVEALQVDYLKKRYDHTVDKPAE